MASIPLLSLSERQYILDGVKQNIRADGRKCDAVGYFNQKTGVASNTNGSAKVDRERTSVLVGVKAELGVPRPTTPHMGRLEFQVDCSALVGPGYEHRGGEVLGRQLTNRLEEAYRSERAMAREDLCVVKGQQCWVLYVDALVLEVGGSLLDTLSLAVRAALQNTTLPELTVTGEGEEFEIEMSDNPNDSIPVKAEGAPIIITLCQVGGRYLVGCSVEEEKCSSCCVGVAVNRDGILSTSMEGGGGIPCTQLDDVIEMGQRTAEGVLDELDSLDQSQQQQGYSELF